MAEYSADERSVYVDSHVVHIRDVDDMDSRYIYIGKEYNPGKNSPFPKQERSFWANKLWHTKEPDPVKRVEAFKEQFFNDPEMMRRVARRLYGKILVCWCAPKPCHGHFLADMSTLSHADILEAAEQFRAKQLEQKNQKQACKRKRSTLYKVKKNLLPHFMKAMEEEDSDEEGVYYHPPDKIKKKNTKQLNSQRPQLRGDQEHQEQEEQEQQQEEQLYYQLSSEKKKKKKKKKKTNTKHHNQTQQVQEDELDEDDMQQSARSPSPHDKQPAEQEDIDDYSEVEEEEEEKGNTSKPGSDRRSMQHAPSHRPIPPQHLDLNEEDEGSRKKRWRQWEQVEWQKCEQVLNPTTLYKQPIGKNNTKFKNCQRVKIN